MEPLSPNDPLWKLLGQAKPVEPRPNFVANVLREARQTPQDRGLWSRVKAWLEESGSAASRVAWAGAVAAAIAVLAALPLLRESQEIEVTKVEKPAAVAVSPATVVAQAPTVEAADYPVLPETDTQWASMEQFDALLAVEDTSELTDREIHFLLY